MAGLDLWFCSFLAALAFALVPAHAQAVVCPAGEFATVGTKSFYWSAAKAKYDGAMAGCPANSSLVNVNSAAEMTSIKAKSETGEPAEKKGVSRNYIHGFCLSQRKAFVYSKIYRDIYLILCLCFQRGRITTPPCTIPTDKTVRTARVTRGWSGLDILFFLSIRTVTLQIWTLPVQQA